MAAPPIEPPEIQPPTPGNPTEPPPEEPPGNPRTRGATASTRTGRTGAARQLAGENARRISCTRAEQSDYAQSSSQLDQARRAVGEAALLQ
jgi:hypothetical protein